MPGAHRRMIPPPALILRSEEHTSELQSQSNLVCRLLLEIKSIILIKLIRVSLGTITHPHRFKIVAIDIHITLKHMLMYFIDMRVNRAKKNGMVDITSSVNSPERRVINTILHELNPLLTINVTMSYIKSKIVYRRVNSKTMPFFLK